ncbi:MAG: polymerase beta subunit [Verrucomicrobiales bacterium]|nr:polymerase beta subunit [Verrucomicrobiales bacterium]
MKFRISKEKLLEGLQQVQNVVSSRATLPVLSNVLIEAESSGLRFTTTDLDIVVSGRIAVTEEPDGPLEIMETGSVTLPARRLAAIVRELPASEVTVTVDSENTAAIRCGNSFFKILGLPAEDFPPPPKFEDVKEFILTQKTLRDALKKTAYAISTDETRYVLNGIYCQFKENKMTLVATDGRRLAMTEAEVEFPESNEAAVIVPTKAVSELQRLLKDDQGQLVIRIGARQIAFELNQSLLVSKLIEGNYPNFRQVIPGAANERVTLEREAFLQAAQRVSLLAPDKSNSVKLHFTKDNIEITANSADIGEARESIAVKYNGPNMAIAFNPEYLVAPFRNLDADEIFLDLIDEVSPGVIKIASPFLYVLMPMRVSQ